MSVNTKAIRAGAALLAIAAVTYLALRLHANATTVGFAYIVTILGIVIATNLATALVSSVAATICFNYFFLPPVRTFTIQDPSNWVALAAFFCTSVIVSRLVTLARREAEEAEARRGEIEALYSLSIDLFTATNRVGALAEATGRALANVGASGGGIVLFGSGNYDQNVVAWIGPPQPQLEDLIAGVGRHRRTLELPAPLGRDVYLPLNFGGRVTGVFVARGTAATLRALESAATLVALAIERERFVAESAHLQAMREGDALKTSLLRAVSHDFVTPLTAISLQIDRLRTVSDDTAVAAIAEQTERLKRRIENLLAMARLEARSVVPRPEPTPAADLFRAAREHLPLIVEGRPIEVRVTPDCPDVYVDPSLALEILVNLIENAHQAAPPGTPIELAAFRHPLNDSITGDRVRLEVADRGPGISAAPSDTPRLGLGLEIARSLGTASGGQVTLANRTGGGAVARIDLPAAQLPVAETEPEEVPA